MWNLFSQALQIWKRLSLRRFFKVIIWVDLMHMMQMMVQKKSSIFLSEIEILILYMYMYVYVFVHI